MRITPRLALLLTLPPLLWAGNAVVGRLAVAHVAPLWLNAARWALAVLLILPLAWPILSRADQRQALWVDLRRHARYLGLLSLTGVGLYNALQYLALTTSTPLNVTLIASSSPVWAMAIGAVLYGERPRPAQLLGAVCSLAGVAVVLGRGELATLLQVRLVPGDVLMLLAILSWSFYSWMLARPPAALAGAQRPAWASHWASFLALQMGLGLLWATAFAATGQVLQPQPLPAPTPLLLWVLLYVAIGPSLLAYRCWGLAVAQAGPALAAFFTNLTPLFAALLSAAMLGEWPRPYHALAFALIVAGIVVSSRSAPAAAAPRSSG